MEEVKDPSGSDTGSVGVEEQAGAHSDSVQTSDPVELLAVITAERDQLAAEKADIQDRLMRRQAEFENYRKRSEREKAEMIDFGKMEAISALLPMVDDFERAIKVESADKVYSKGMELIYQRMQEGLKKAGLVVVETVGAKFDPNLHHAVDKFQTEEHEEDTILEEYQKGYHFRDRLLRPAMVKVAVRP